jgi:hypothetical protein
MVLLLLWCLGCELCYRSFDGRTGSRDVEIFVWLVAPALFAARSLRDCWLDVVAAYAEPSEPVWSEAYLRGYYGLPPSRLYAVESRPDRTHRTYSGQGPGGSGQRAGCEPWTDEDDEDFGGGASRNPGGRA